jgi:hypothetical protein
VAEAYIVDALRTAVGRRGGREQDVHALATVQRGRAISTVSAAAWQNSESKPVAVLTRKYLVG